MALGRWFGQRVASTDRIGIVVGPQGLVGARVAFPEGSAGRPRLLGIATYPSGSESDWGDGMRKLARDLSAQHLITTVVPHAQLVSLLQLSAPPTPPAERAGALKFRAREVSQIPVEDMLLDYLDVPGTRARGAEPPTYCAIASRERMTLLRDAVLGAGMQMEAIDVADMALCHLVGRTAGEAETVAALMLGNQGLRFVIVHQRSLSLFRSSTLNAEHFRDSLADHVDQLLLEVQRTIDFYESHYTTAPPKRLLVMPDWPFNQALVDALEPSLRVRPERFVLSEAIASAELATGPAPDLALLAIGAALRPDTGASA